MSRPGPLEKGAFSLLGLEASGDNEPMRFGIRQEMQADVLVLRLEGHFDEQASLPTLDPLLHPKIEMNFEKITLINSVGVRSWIKWVSDKQGKSKISYTHCPKIIVDQMNMVSALSKSGQVESFYVPYFCEASSTSVQFLFRRGKEFDEKTLRFPTQVPCPNGDSMAEIDVIEKTYFKFLNLSALPTP
ncbi:MAG: hypothetical protein WCH11_04930 [Bdellovibrio sp.]